MKKFLIHLVILSLASCSTMKEVTYSSRDINPEEKLEISQWDGREFDRSPANWINSCVSSVSNFFRPKESIASGISLKPLPELTQLNPSEKVFPNGKKYIEYRANINVMNKYPDYDVFLEETAEIIFEPTEPFGHINLRVGKNIYSFNNVRWTSINSFSPRMKASTKPEELFSSHGFVFQLGKDKIDSLKKEIDAFYNSSQSHNIPAFDAYSPLLKIAERENNWGGGKKLFYVTDSPKYGNNQEINGKIVEVNGKMVLDAGNGVTVPVIKKGDHYYTQSYSCSSSAGHVLERFFGITVSHNISAKSLAASLLKGNINQSISPIAVIKYYEE